jgi:hypothetical protein
MDISAVKDYGIGLRLTVKRLRSNSAEGKANAPLWRSVATAVKQASADVVDPVVRLLLLKEIVAVVEIAGVEPSTTKNVSDIAAALQTAVAALPASVGTAERVALRQAALELCEPKPCISSWIRDCAIDGWTQTTLLEVARGVQRKLGLPTLLRFEVGSNVIALCSSRWLACEVVACYDGNLGSSDPVYDVRVADADRNGRERLRGAVVPVAIDGQVKEDDGTFRVADSVACSMHAESDDEDAVLDPSDPVDDTADTACSTSDAHDEAEGGESDAEDDEVFS